MGVETGLAVAALVVGGVSAYEANRQQKKAADKEEDAQAAALAEQKAQQAQQTRAQIREERIRRAQILQSSENTGVSASSGALGSVGALQTNVGANLAAATRSANTTTAITGFQQQAADYRSKANTIQAVGNLTSSAIFAGGGLFANSATPTDTGVNAPVAPGSQSPATQPNPYNLFG